MIKGYSITNNREIEYQWTIKNFTDNFNFFTSDKEYTIESPRFNFKDKECKCYIKMTFSTKSISCSLELLPSYQRIKLAGQLSVVCNNGETFKTVNVKVYKNANYCGYEILPVLKIESNDLLFKALDLFPNNNLKVVCNLTIFDECLSISPFNSQKQHQSMNDHFKELLNSQNGSDVVFEVGDQEFKAHKLVLMTRSPVFLAMFNNDMVENNSNRVKVEDISWSIFELLLEFIYTDKITKEVDEEIGLDLLRAASKYQLEGLEALCETRLCSLLTVNNAMDILVVADLHNLTNFVKSIKNFIKIHQKEIQSIIKPEHFLMHPHHAFVFLTIDQS